MLRPKEVVCKWVDAFNDHDVEAIVSLYHDNATNHQVTNEPVIGIEAIREMFTTEFTTADMTAIVENICLEKPIAVTKIPMSISTMERPIRIKRLRIFPCCERENFISKRLLG